jgi:hypothetical protein
MKLGMCRSHPIPAQSSPDNRLYRDKIPMCMLPDFDCAAHNPHACEYEGVREHTISDFASYRLQAVARPRLSTSHFVSQ